MIPGPEKTDHLRDDLAVSMMLSATDPDTRKITEC